MNQIVALLVLLLISSFQEVKSQNYQSPIFSGISTLLKNQESKIATCLIDTKGHIIQTIQTERNHKSTVIAKPGVCDGFIHHQTVFPFLIKSSDIELTIFQHSDNSMCYPVQVPGRQTGYVQPCEIILNQVFKNTTKPLLIIGKQYNDNNIFENDHIGIMILTPDSNTSVKIKILKNDETILLKEFPANKFISFKLSPELIKSGNITLVGEVTKGGIKEETNSFNYIYLNKTR